MENLSKLLESFASLLWPLSFVAILVYFRSSIASVIESAKGRKFTLKVAGNELTMEQVTEQQRHIITDLQEKIASLEEGLERLQSGASPESDVRDDGKIDVSKLKILWVDDNPKNNSFLVASLGELGVDVHIAKSTTEGIQLFNSIKYDRVISDMGRPEGGQAGIDLTKLIRESGSDVPVYIYCGKWAASNFKESALAAGVTGLTSSGTSLLKMLRLNRANKQSKTDA
ncbi:response regulator [Vibrio gazogenes]|uniref:CheY chemotaxis protein or a CheY-like REC (Receiver) domain n=1 Tax=Vibrio gazogenes DSM 21264 = NBRC 103151 TaxID=1123492 RepID=A0A1M5DZ65_VIBGA|nr:response regulator [Vibrio gazogenes]USP14924.1 response regulator [Vibrio gazogenes]SHF72235.1 CheY chemotaxis protein or a CheY-like REC (receiver) domain [Vibrio gazogenes DSM 21264] [Vibrio gazogenes DSM 21264 = NBRC 103151]SJN54334.1 hybrid sensory kinase in two-component regulatory system with RcsB and YojN [Vibrio gazogenes]